MTASTGTGSPRQECVLTVCNLRHGPAILGYAVLEGTVGGLTDAAKLHNRLPPEVDNCEALFLYGAPGCQQCPNRAVTV